MSNDSEYIDLITGKPLEPWAEKAMQKRDKPTPPTPAMIAAGERALVGMSDKHWGRAEACWNAMIAFADAPRPTSEGVIAREVKRMRELAADWRRPELRQVEGPNDLKIYGGTIADDIERWSTLLSQREQEGRPTSAPVVGEREATPEMLAAWVEYDPPFAVSEATNSARVSTMLRHAFLSGWLAREQAAPPPPVEGAIPAGMKPWHGGDAAPEDWDPTGDLLTRCGICLPGKDGEPFWHHNFSAGDIIAYTPKATASPPSEVLEVLIERCASAIENWEDWGEWYGLDRNNRVAMETCTAAAKRIRALIAEHDATKGGRDD